MVEHFKHVLLADDDQDDCTFFEEAFSAAFPGIKLSIFKDGGELMEHLCKPQQPLADIIFLDLNMPIKNGLDCLTEIRADAALNKKIVIIFTTSSHPDDIARLFEMGANYFITKPNDFKQLQGQITFSSWKFLMQ